MIAAVAEHRFVAFGGTCECHLVALGVDDDVLREMEDEVRAFEATLSRFDARSELSRLNAAAGTPIAVSPLLAALLSAGLDAAALSDGIVSIAVGNAVVAAGYATSFDTATARTWAPTATRAHALPPVGSVLTVDAGVARVSAGHTIDLGGIAKGWLADSLSERLDAGVINIGGDVRCVGDDVDGDGWRVATPGGATVVVRDGAVATSGTSRRRWSGGHHLIDPRSGASAIAGDVTVTAPTAFIAEIAAKVALIAAASERARLLTRLDAVVVEEVAAP